MTFEVTRVSIMDIEGVDDEREAFLILRELSKDTEGRTMLFQGRPISYVQHVSTVAKLVESASKSHAVARTDAPGRPAIAAGGCACGASSACMAGWRSSAAPSGISRGIATATTSSVGAAPSGGSLDRRRIDDRADPGVDRSRPRARHMSRRNGPKVTCPVCGNHSESEVQPDSSMGAAVVEGGEMVYRRRRKCKECGARYVTVERVERPASGTASV